MRGVDRGLRLLHQAREPHRVTRLLALPAIVLLWLVTLVVAAVVFAMEDRR